MTASKEDSGGKGKKKGLGILDDLQALTKPRLGILRHQESPTKPVNLKDLLNCVNFGLGTCGIWEAVLDNGVGVMD